MPQEIRTEENQNWVSKLVTEPLRLLCASTSKLWLSQPMMTRFSEWNRHKTPIWSRSLNEKKVRTCLSVYQASKARSRCHMISQKREPWALLASLLTFWSKRLNLTVILAHLHLSSSMRPVPLWLCNQAVPVLESPQLKEVCCTKKLKKLLTATMPTNNLPKVSHQTKESATQIGNHTGQTNVTVEWDTFIGLSAHTRCPPPCGQSLNLTKWWHLLGEQRRARWLSSWSIGSSSSGTLTRRTPGWRSFKRLLSKARKLPVQPGLKKRVWKLVKGMQEGSESGLE